MTSSDGKELKFTIDTVLPWKMVVKGSRSLKRRNKKSLVQVAASDIEVEDKSPTDNVVGESEPEKLGYPVLSQQFAERRVNVPIKKRMFMVCSPSPSKSSAQCEVSEQREHMNNALPVSRLNPNVNEGRTSGISDEKLDCSDHDFSGIKILADVACSSDVSNDIAPAVESLLAKESVVRQQDASNLSTHVEGKDSSAGTADVSQKDTADDSTDQAEQGKSGIVPAQISFVETICNDLADEQSVEHSRVASGGMLIAKKTSIALSDESSTERPKATAEVSESVNLAPDSGASMVSEKSTADEPTEQSNEGLKDVRFHWDLNVPIDAWGQPCDVEDEVSGRNVVGEITESIACKESEPISESKDQIDGVIASDGDAIVSTPSGPKADDAGARNDKECQSGYDSQFEDGELREPYPWEESDGDVGDVEQLDYGSEPDDERFYSMVENNDNKMEVSEKEILAETKFGAVECESADALRIGEANEGSDIERHVVVFTRDSHPKRVFSSPSRNFGSKSCKEFTSHDAIQKRSFRPNSYREFNKGQDIFLGREDRSGMRMRHRSPGRDYFSGWDSKRRFSSGNYKGDSYGFRRPRPKSTVDDRNMISGFDQSESGPGHGPGSGSGGHVRRQFSNGGYQGQCRRFPDGGNRDFRGLHGDMNQYPRPMNNRMSGNKRERGNSPVFRRLNYQQSESRSRSRSPVSWNGRNRLSPRTGGFRAEERMMDSARFRSQKRFLADQEMGFMSPPRNRMSPRFFEGNNNYGGENHNAFRERKFCSGPRFDARNPMRRFNSDNNHHHHFKPFVRHKRFDAVEENTGGNRFDMPQQRTRQSEATEDGAGDDVRRPRFYGGQSVEVANDNNNES